MQRILMIGATSSLGQVTRDYLLANSDDQLTLLAPQATRLVTDDGRETVINGEPSCYADLVSALQAQDVVLTVMPENSPWLVANLVRAMSQRHLTRLVMVGTTKRYNEGPAHLDSATLLKPHRDLKFYRQTADLLEQSQLTYTIIRPAARNDSWRDDETATSREMIGGRRAARLAVADLILTAIDQHRYIRENVGIERPA